MIEVKVVQKVCLYHNMLWNISSQSVSVPHAASILSVCIRGQGTKAILVQYYNSEYAFADCSCQFITMTICERARAVSNNSTTQPAREEFRYCSEDIFRRLFRERRILSFPASQPTTLPLQPFTLFYPAYTINTYVAVVMNSHDRKKI